MRGFLYAVFGLAALIGTGAIMSLVVSAFSRVDSAVDKSVDDEVKKFRHRGFL